ncbi:TonB-dependent receptor [Trichocoleus desertorum AS-A10]|uniref:TonB-dependent receptor n=1 Tax=Trichocoleus desertorum TaxID=1481672 RepID=UPI00329A432C
MTTKPTGSKINALKLGLLGAITGTVGLSGFPLAAQASTEFEVSFPETSIQPGTISSGNEALHPLIFSPQLSDNLITAQAIAPVTTTPDAKLEATATETAPPLPATTTPSAEASPVPENTTASTESNNQTQPAIKTTPGSIPADVAPAVTPTPAATPENTSPVAPTEVKILTPTTNTVLDIPATTVILQFVEGTQVQLQTNGATVSTTSIGRTETDTKTRIITQIWYGVPLKEGDNTITAQPTTNGVAGTPVAIQVQVRGSATQLSIQTVETRIPADSRSTATVQGQLLDGKGNRSNRDAIVTLSTSAGEFVGADAKTDEPGFQVQARQGQFTANLRSSLQAQTVTVRANIGELEAFTQLQFETNLRPSIATGVIDVRLGRRGSDYYGSFRDYLPLDGDNSTELDVRGSVFATGKVGDWLFTGAYNSDRNLNQTCDANSRLYRDTQFCEQNYPVYGDSSRVDNLTPSKDSLYLRVERSAKIAGAAPDYAMWGDYNTNEFSTKSQQFTAFTRQLHGFKANYNIGDLQVTGFYGNNVEGFQRDTIAPDGTSGYYFLSRRLLVPGSENVFIELEELNRPGTVLDRQSLNRGPDYDIDYDRGSVIFRKPILRTDISDEGEVLVRRIVVTYQYEGQGTSNIYGGRVQYHLDRTLNHESWLGATYLKENQGIRDFELYGADALINLGSKGQLIAEYAHSKHDSEVMGKVSGSAYRLEAQGEIAKGIQGRAYYRAADPGFANDATISFVPGQTRYGAQVTGKLSDTTNLRAQYDHEDNYGVAPRSLDTLEDLFAPRSTAIPGSQVDNSLTTISAGIQQKIGKSDLTVDWIHRDREDRLYPDLSGTSDQLRSRVTVPIASNLTFLAQNEMTLSGKVDSVYNDRTLVGLDWKPMPGVDVRLAQQFFTRGQYAGNSITSLDVNSSYKLGSDTTLTGRYSLLGGADGMKMQGAVGLNQRWNIAPGLRMDLAYEHVFGNYSRRTAAGSQFLQPFASGQSASSLALASGDSYSVGLEYTDNPKFQASARYEHRSSSEGSNTVISAAATGKITPSLTALVRYHQASAANQKLSDLGDTKDLKIGLAYRDIHSDKFNALLRYEYRQNPSIIPDSLLLGNGTGSEEHLLAAEAIYAPNWRWEFYGKYAFRHSSTYLAKDLVGTSSVSLAQLRATYRLGYSWDVVGEARWINQPNTGYSETGFNIEAGYYMTPNLRLAAGYGFGRASDRDFSGSRSVDGPYLGLTVKLNELFDGFGLQKAPQPQQQPQTKPVASHSSSHLAHTTATSETTSTTSELVPAASATVSGSGE